MNRTTLSLLASVALLPLAAQAQVLRIKCEVSATRSVAAVDGKRLPAGDYTALLSSGGQRVVADPLPATLGEVQFDFSSRRRDIAAGATAIPANFIEGAQVSAELYDAAGQVVARGSRVCRQR